MIAGEMARSARVAIQMILPLQEHGDLSKDCHMAVTFLFLNRKIKYSYQEMLTCLMVICLSSVRHSI